MPSRRGRLEETGARGEAIYREKIRPLVEPAETGKFVVIDIERLRERRPNAVSYGIRVGHGAAYSLG